MNHEKLKIFFHIFSIVKMFCFMPKEFDTNMKSEKAKNRTQGTCHILQIKFLSKFQIIYASLGMTLIEDIFFTAYFLFFVIHLLRYFDII